MTDDTRYLGVPDQRDRPDARTSGAAAWVGDAPRTRPWPRQWTLALPVIMLLVVPVAIGYLLLRPPPPFTPSFAGPDRLVTNERAHHHPDMPGVRQSDDWTVTAGSLFARDGAGWTGHPDAALPDAESGNGTGSAVFRVVSDREDFRDVELSLRLRVEALVDPADSHSYDGAHLFLRYQSPDEFYGVTVFRRDGLVLVKRKLPGADGRGSYATLAAVNRPQPMNDWINLGIRVVTLDSGSVRLTLRIDGDHVLTATDRGRRGRAIADAGRVGLRGDNCQFSFTDFRAAELRH